MKRIVYLDILRIVSCILVVGVHVSAMNWNDVAVTSVKWQVMNAYDCVSILGVPLFFMISGALMLNDSYEINLKKLFFSKLLRLFIAYNVWLLIYNTIPFITGETELSFSTVKENLIYRMLMGQGIYHLWFIPELMMLYLISPILQQAFRNKGICEYFLAVFTITGVIIPFVLKFQIPYRSFLQSMYSRSSLTMVTGYIGYFVMGHYIHSFMSKVERNRLLLAALILLGIIATVSICGIDSVRTGQPSTIVNNPLMITDFVACFGIFTLARNCIEDKENSKWTDRLHKITTLTFGIYLVHPLVIRICENVGMSNLTIHPIVMIPVNIAIVTVISGTIIYILSKLPLINKWII